MNIRQAVQETVKLLLLVTILNIIIAKPIAAQPQIFGQPGRHGIDGDSGHDGTSPSRQEIRASQQLQTVDLSGTDGKAGESGTSGEHASECQQPKDTTVNLCGAEGGNGGNGGTGGNGGKGGDTILYYGELPQLKNVVLRNRGGRGGSGGNGGQAGNGCNCTQPRWSVNYCTWALMAQPLNVADARWIEVQRQAFRCSGDSYYDEEQYRPDPPQADGNYRYGWKYISLSEEAAFTCENGQSGKYGSRGADGEPGSYGQVWLVQGDRIPPEQVSYIDHSSRLSGKTISLLKNRLLAKGHVVRASS